MPFSRQFTHHRYSLLRRVVSRANWRAWLVLLLFLLTSAGVAHLLAKREYDASVERFAERANDVVLRIQERLRQHEQILLGGVGLFAAKSGEVSRAQWQSYVNNLNLAHNYPGIQGVGFALAVPAPQLAAHQAQLQAQGFPAYQVRPQGARDIYFPIIYLEPFAGRNLAAFGYDMYSEATRRQAMQAAAYNARTTISAKVKLVQENQGKVQAGFLMYLPVYKEPERVSSLSPEQRMQQLRGFVYSPYRMGDLMAGLLAIDSLDLDFRIYQGADLSPAAQMYDSAAERNTEEPPPTAAPIFRQSVIAAYGQRWTIQLQSRPAYLQQARSRLPQAILLLGSALGVAVFLLISSLTFSRLRALELAQEMTGQMRRNQEQLMHSEERFELAVRGSNDGIWDWDMLNGRAYCSPRLQQMLCLSSLRDNEMRISRDLHELRDMIHPADLAAAESGMQSHLQTGIPLDLNVRLRAGADWRWFNVRGQAVRRADGKAQRIAGAISDISERMRVEKMKSEFISTVNHELRTPLTSIQGALTLLCSGKVAAERMGSLLDIAQKNSQRLAALVNDLLDLDKMIAGKFVFDMQVHNLGTIIEHALEATQTYAMRYQVSFVLTNDCPQVRVKVDANRLHQVLLNLFSNAAKFSPPGAKVEVAVAPAEGQVKVAVTDHGRGIPAAFQERIFEKFSQADASNTRAREGSGLGLAIARELMERMQGSIGFTSEEGTGSCFYLCLPIFAEAEESATDALVRGEA